MNNNDLYWEKIDGSEYRLKDAQGRIIAYLVNNFGDRWVCRLFNNYWDMSFSVVLEGLKNTEGLIWQATVWIYNTCNQIANSFHHIRDHLPDLHKLSEAAE